MRFTKLKQAALGAVTVLIFSCVFILSSITAQAADNPFNIPPVFPGSGGSGGSGGGGGGGGSNTKPPIPNGCPGSGTAGPPGPICDKIPAGCPGSTHSGPHKPGSQCPYASPGGSGGGSGGSGGSGGGGGGNGGNGGGQGGNGGNGGGQGGGGNGGNGGNGGGGGGGAGCSLTNGQCASCYGDKCIDCSKTACTDSAIDCSQGNCDLIDTYVNPAVKVLSIIVGIVVVMSLILGGIQYSASEGDPQKAAQARDRIAKTILALLVYIFLYAFLQFLIPGGVFNRH